MLGGRPGVAKSQFRKHIINVDPRGMYCTGRGISGAGRTAVV
jgi:DNA replicative helicase MCM subunit Mcm2 (Cdc46/Mcm family)